METLIQPWLLTSMSVLLAVGIVLHLFAVLRTVTKSEDVNNEQKQEPSENKGDRPKVLENIGILIRLALVVFLFILFFKWLYKVQTNLFIEIFVIVNTLFLVMTALYHIYGVLNYLIIGKAEKYKKFGLKEENYIYGSALYIFILIKFILSEVDFSEFIMNLAPLGNQFLLDLIYIFLTFIITFIILFYGISILWLSLSSARKIVLSFNAGRRGENVSSKASIVEKILVRMTNWREGPLISQKFLTSNELPKRLKRKLLYSSKYIMLCILDVLFMPIELFIKTVIDIVAGTYTLFSSIFKHLRINIVKKINNMGKTIYSVAMISIVISVLATYIGVLNEGVVTDNSISVFEFVSSVILIPIILAQIMSIREEN